MTNNQGKETQAEWVGRPTAARGFAGISGVWKCGLCGNQNRVSTMLNFSRKQCDHCLADNVFDSLSTYPRSPALGVTPASAG